jgi:hypothetical protein
VISSWPTKRVSCSYRSGTIPAVLAECRRIDAGDAQRKRDIDAGIDNRHAERAPLQVTW